MQAHQNPPPQTGPPAHLSPEPPRRPPRIHAVIPTTSIASRKATGGINLSNKSEMRLFGDRLRNHPVYEPLRAMMRSEYTAYRTFMETIFPDLLNQPAPPEHGGGPRLQMGNNTYADVTRQQTRRLKAFPPLHLHHEAPRK